MQMMGHVFQMPIGGRNDHDHKQKFLLGSVGDLSRYVSSKSRHVKETVKAPDARHAYV